jgi:hypothetical protein
MHSTYALERLKLPPCINETLDNLMPDILRLKERFPLTQHPQGHHPATAEHHGRARVYALLARTSAPVGPFSSSAAQGGAPGT